MATRDKSLERNTFQRLSLLYVVALSAIALSIVISQILVQRHLRSQLGDSRVVNVAGRQRMLSQKLTKETLLLTQNEGRVEDSLLMQLQGTLELWRTSHQWLQQGDSKLGLAGDNSETIQQMFQEIAPYYNQMLNHTTHIIQLLQAKTPRSELQVYVAGILHNEPIFLEHMDKIVFQFDEEAQEKIRSLRRIEILLLLLAIGILMIELFFIFRPTAFRISNIIKELVTAEANATATNKEIEVLYEEKEQSLQELRTLNFALDQAVLFASASIDGQVIYMSDKFSNLLQLKKENIKGNLAELISTQEGEQEYLKELIRTARSNIWNGAVKVTNSAGTELWLEMSILPVNRKGIKQDLLIICSDITSRKKAQSEIDRLKEEQFAEQIHQQKLRSSQVVEAQEEERKRIARDIHDGIGQMLTALRFNLQSIDLQKPEKAADKLKKVNEIAAGVIRGIRITTFNLTPPELTDYGIAPALNKLAEQLTQLTEKTIVFYNRTDFMGRFSSVIETNLYRVTQEAVNNAIKYAQSNYIMITLSHSVDLLSIVVDDDGIGFNPDELRQEPSDDGSGMGINFMKERINFINGRLFIHSVPAEGTRITVNMPIEPTILPK